MFCSPCYSAMNQNEAKRRAQLRARVDDWSKRLRVKPQSIRVRRMVRKWGSCSTNGVVTLAYDLAARPSEFQDFVIVHELLHLRIRNHGRLFKATLGMYVKSWKSQSVFRSV